MLMNCLFPFSSCINANRPCRMRITRTARVTHACVYLHVELQSYSRATPVRNQGRSWFQVRYFSSRRRPNPVWLDRAAGEGKKRYNPLDYVEAGFLLLPSRRRAADYLCFLIITLTSFIHAENVVILIARLFCNFCEITVFCSFKSVMHIWLISAKLL